MEYPLDNPLGNMFQQPGGDTHLVFYGLEDIGIAYGTCQLVGIGSPAEIGLQFQINGKISTYGCFLRVYSVIGIQFDSLQMNVHVSGLHKRKRKESSFVFEGR